MSISDKDIADFIKRCKTLSINHQCIDVPSGIDGEKSRMIAAIKNREDDVRLAIAKLKIALTRYEKQYGDKK